MSLMRVFIMCLLSAYFFFAVSLLFMCYAVLQKCLISLLHCTVEDVHCTALSGLQDSFLLLPPIGCLPVNIFKKRRNSLSQVTWLTNTMVLEDAFDSCSPGLWLRGVILKRLRVHWLLGNFFSWSVVSWFSWFSYGHLRRYSPAKVLLCYKKGPYVC